MRFAPISEKFPHFLHGGDYSPEQWTPDVWERDMELMKQSNCNTLSVGIFAWRFLEPEEGKYDFSWLDQVMDLLAENGHYAVLATPSASPPLWMCRKYPQIMMVDGRNVRSLPGTRARFCLNSELYRAKVREINFRLAERYGNHPALLVWHISNEYSQLCYCDDCREKFREFLKEKYGSLDTLNHAWWNMFWSQSYSAWEEIDPPVENGIMGIEALRLEWFRFQTASVTGFMAEEVAPLRELTPSIPVTTNTMGLFYNYDTRAFAPLCDVMSYDAYPWYHDRKDNPETAAGMSFIYDMYRASKGGKPWMLMESTPSSGNWFDRMKLKRPGVHFLSSMQAVAHGADTVQYFQFRKGRGGAEKFHGAVVDHASDADSRVFREVTEVGAALRKFDAVIGTSVRPEVAVIFDWENRWAIDFTQGPHKTEKKYQESCIDHYRQFWKRGIPVDVIGEADDFSGYKLIVAPMLYLLKDGVARRLTAFVRAGGTLVATYWSGLVDATALCFDTGFPGPLREVLGIRSEELDVLYPDERCPVSVEFAGMGGTYDAHTFCDLIHAENAAVKAVYAGEFYAGRPALTVNAFGKGEAWYIAFRSGEDFLGDFYGVLAKKLKLRRALDSELPEGVTAQLRGEFVFVMNFSREARALRLPGRFEDLVNGGMAEGELPLAPYAVRVLASYKKS